MGRGCPWGRPQCSGVSPAGSAVAVLGGSRCTPLLGGGLRGPKKLPAPASAHHILFSPCSVHILGCVSPVLPQTAEVRQEKGSGSGGSTKTLPGSQVQRRELARALPPPQHPAPAPHSRCLAPHQFQAWGPSHGAGAPPGHTTWPTSSSLAMSTLTEPLTQPRHPAVLSCSPASCAARPAVHLAPPPRLHLSPCSASAQAALLQGCRELLSACEQEPRDSSSSSQALTARGGSPDLGRFPLERAATHAPPCSQAGLQQGHRPGRAGGRRGEGLGQDGAQPHHAVCTPLALPRAPRLYQHRGERPAPSCPLRGPEASSARGRRDERDAPCCRWQEPYGAGATGPAVGTGSLREAEGTGHLPALVATEGHRKAWKLEAQSSLTVPMARRPRVGQGEPGGHRAARQQLPAAGTPGCPRRPRSVWSRGRRLWQREAPAAGAHAPAAANPRSLPAQGPAGAHGQRPVAQSHLEDTELGKFVAAAPRPGLPAPCQPPTPTAAAGGVFLERFYPSVLEL